MCGCTKNRATLTGAEKDATRWRVRFAGGAIKPYLTETEARVAHQASAGSTLLAPSA